MRLTRDLTSYQGTVIVRAVTIRLMARDVLTHLGGRLPVQPRRSPETRKRPESARVASPWKRRCAVEVSVWVLLGSLYLDLRAI